jgi:hypothetical protein
MESTVLRLVFCTPSREPQVHVFTSEAKRISGGFGNKAFGDVSFDSRFKQEASTFKASAAQLEAFFLDRGARKAFLFA